MTYTFEQLNDISKDLDRIKSIIEQRDIFRRELIDIALENKHLIEENKELNRKCSAMFGYE